MITPIIPFITACLCLFAFSCHAASLIDSGQAPIFDSDIKQAIDRHPQTERTPTDLSHACSSDLKASILVPQAQMIDRSQLRYGQLGHFEQHLSTRVSQILNRELQQGFALPFATERLDFTPSLSPKHSANIPHWLNKITNSQYLLIPTIESIATEDERYLLGLWEIDPQRQFVLKLTLYHGISGEQIWQKRYLSQAEWGFNKHTHVDSGSQIFWGSEYGQNIDNVLVQVSQDLDSTLACRPVIAQIIARSGSQVMMNVGRRNGVKVGDTFKLALQNPLTDRFNLERITAVKTQTTITLEQVSENTASAHLSPRDAALNIQINDLILK
ncbi:flagella assembly protein FlgT middle domain-containing protein [Shewanella surugensis]|uniref:Flagellar biosynthesis protein FlgT n=1 Tax=Shewanella surugensis TaxID=212020 RepID=A0ABT0LJI7_9GAMM|nr:flagella assembly protein FlgT middle domain-containing protein [Shewanella surugensis]MCL1127620.1 flagellar biosynthesis protein FlgT [Shewanella surugensis]